VWTWGNNNHGQLGDNTTVDRSKPVKVSGLDHIVDVAASMDGTFSDPYGSQHSLAVRSDGTVFAWGANTDGELGDGTVTERHTPGRVAGIASATAVAAGSQHSVARLRDGSTVSWGANNKGQLGDGTSVGRRTPVTTKGLRGATQLDAGDDFTLGLAPSQSLPPIPAAITYQGTMTYEGPPTSDGRLAVTTPNRTRKGNILLAHVAARSNAALPAPTGWATAARGHLGTLVDAIFWRVAQRDGSQTYTFAVGGATDGTAVITTYSGASTVNPVTAASSAVSSGTLQTARSITTPVPNCRLFAVFTTDAYGIDRLQGYDELWRTDFKPNRDATVEGTAADLPHGGPTGDVHLRTTEASAIDHLVALRPAALPTTK
ncbi:MAG: hypothetical protein M3Z46_09960, partial [Actinomycetota bacterium]|nr:hypothetical protein [Actinomycetota bacterium]